MWSVSPLGYVDVQEVAREGTIDYQKCVLESIIDMIRRRGQHFIYAGSEAVLGPVERLDRGDSGVSEREIETLKEMIMCVPAGLVRRMNLLPQKAKQKHVAPRPTGSSRSS